LYGDAKMEMKPSRPTREVCPRHEQREDASRARHRMFVNTMIVSVQFFTAL